MNYVQPGYVRTGYVQQDSDTQGPFRFDGYGRFVFVSTALARLDVAEMYSRWIDWLGETDSVGDNNAKWPAAMRYSGRDPIPGGFTGTTFFMTNGWRVRYNPTTTAVDGVLFSEDFDTAYWSLDRQPVYPVQVSAVVNQVTTTTNVVTGDVGAVAGQVRTELALELLRIVELAKLHGLVPGVPLQVNETSRVAGDVAQTINTSGTTTTVTRT
jgi:hypothetical protein